MMEDALSEDTMMDCGGDGGALEDLVDLATDVADSSPTIRDAAQRLLTLLGVDDGDDPLSSSEDEGVELDDLEDDDEEDSTRLLHQLAASLAEELKYSHQKHPPRLLQGRSSHEPRDRHQLESMETTQDTSYLEHSCLQDQVDLKGTTARYHENVFLNQDEAKHAFETFCQNGLPSTFFGKEVTSPGFVCLDRRRRPDEPREETSSDQQEQVLAFWGAGWDACATEALRYLVEDEGLPPYHPTVVAMKNHLELQRERTFAQYTA